MQTMSAETAVRRAVARAQSVLPGRPALEGQPDPRWQAIIRVGTFIESHPEPVWEFARRWGKHAQADLRAAVATCLLEHLLETISKPSSRASATRPVPAYASPTP
ncbi:MAG: hypothetical protein JWN40_5474 [Phycisphaerales bacterium]|nr:hypothetical protein [Phycisphaerales bacterium]